MDKSMYLAHRVQHASMQVSPSCVRLLLLLLLFKLDSIKPSPLLHAAARALISAADPSYTFNIASIGNPSGI
jgi:hypothetical protein